MRDSEQPEVRLGRELQLNVLELRKADRLGIYSKELTAWIRFIEHWQNEADLQTLNYEPVTKAMGKLREISADEKERWAAFSRERALSDYNTLMLEAREEGLEQGREQGLERGLEQGREQGLELGERKLLKKLLISRFGNLPQSFSERLEQASLKELEAWAENVLKAESIEAVFNKAPPTQSN